MQALRTSSGADRRCRWGQSLAFKSWVQRQATAASSGAGRRYYSLPKVDGFEPLKSEYVKEIDGQATLWKHQSTGAELLSIKVDDRNKVFGINFRTPPDSSDGIAHILEHSVLCGSKKYPVKEPFVELLKSSLQTFLNAFTYPDRTCYPVASQNLKDFYNLIDVYMDAVLHPRLTPEVLMQEGWHYELDSKDGKMALKGVVFNEMKGVYSNPDSMNYRRMQQSLFPDNIYGVDSGGDPQVIPTLTFEKFQSFHGDCYHPSNAMIYFYGDDPEEQRLRLMAEYLTEFQRKSPQPLPTLQAPFSSPKRVSFPFASSSEDKQHMMTVGWVLNHEDPSAERTLELVLLSELLLGTEASPLRKALLSSGLGFSLTGGGLSTTLRQFTFAVGLKKVAEEDVDKVEALVLSELKRLSEEGFSPSTIESAMNTVEFSLREKNSGSYPRGLLTMLSALDRWVYHGDPIESIKYEKELQALKDKLKKGEPVFQDLIREHLLENSHRVSLHMIPDKSFDTKQEEEEGREVENFRQRCSEDDLENIIEKTKSLKEKQLRNDPPEELAKIPKLTLKDIEDKQPEIPVEIANIAGGKVVLLSHDLPTSSVIYVDLAFDLRGLRQRRALTIVVNGNRIGTATGGISTSRYVTAIDPLAGDDLRALLMVRAKATKEKIGDMGRILVDLLTEISFDDRERCKEIVRSQISGLQSKISASGHVIAQSRLGWQDNVSGWLDEVLGGIEQYNYLQTLLKDIETDWSSVLNRLEDMRSSVLQRQGLVVNLTGDESTLHSSSKPLHELLESLPEGEDRGTEHVWKWQATAKPLSEAFVIPTQVNYVGAGGNLFTTGYKYDGSIHVVSKFLGTSYLWDRVRVHGGAYGGFARFSRRSGQFAFLSYRDPNLLDTLEVYGGAAAFLKSKAGELTEKDISDAVIGTIAGVDHPLLPDAQGFASLCQYLVGESPEERQARRTQILKTDRRHFGEVAMALFSLKKRQNIAVVASEEAVNAANSERQMFRPIKVQF